MVQLQLFHPPLLCPERGGTKRAQIIRSRAEEILKDFREKTILSLRLQKCSKATLGSSKRDPLRCRAVWERRELYPQRNLEMRSSNREGSTQVVHLNRNKSVFYLLAPDTEKEDGIVEPPSAAHTHHDSSLQTKKNNPKWWNTECFLMCFLMYSILTTFCYPSSSE